MASGGILGFHYTDISPRELRQPIEGESWRYSMKRIYAR